MHANARRAVALAVLAVLASCRDVNVPTVSTGRSIVPDVKASLSRTGSASVPIILRGKPLGPGVSASKVIGPEGGTLELPAAGFTLRVPAGAVTKATAFSVTALPGRAVGYEFEPHGTTFNVPLVGLQSLSGLTAQGGTLDAGSMVLGYFADRSEVSGLSATIHEVFSLHVDSQNNALVAIPHFSGYILATGRCRSDDE